MAEAVTPEEATFTWSGRAVEIGRIEAELARLRQEAAGAEGFAIRTSLLNLVVHAADGETARHAAQVIAGLPGHHPSRALIAVARPSEEESRIDAQLAAHCHPSGGPSTSLRTGPSHQAVPAGRQVCCEEVTLKVSGRAAHHLHSIIIPLLVSDLPVYIWWTGALPRAPHVFEQMLGAADRFIVDSARFARPAEGLSRLARLCAEHSSCGVGDLSWGRLAPWRQLIAQHCDTPGLEPCLEPISSVEIRYAEGEGRQRPPSQALRLSSGQAFLLLGWLAARFGWDTEKASVRKSGGFTLPSRAGDVAVSVGAGAACEGLAPGWLASVRLRSGGEQGSASLSIERTEDPQHLSLRIEGQETALQSRVLIEACDEGEMLAQELDTSGHDTEYEEALRRAVSLLKALR